MPPAAAIRCKTIKAEKPTAPNLAGYASREWLAGLLDPKQINGPQYFGNTKFRGGKMAGFVKENFSELDADEKKNLKRSIAAVSAEAKLPSQQQLDAKDAKAIAGGAKAAWSTISAAPIVTSSTTRASWATPPS